MAKQVMMNGIAHVARREDIHVKRGEYTHGDVKGWNLYEVDTGRLVISSDPGRPRSSYEFQQAKYPTFADLMDAVHDLEDHLKSLAARRQDSINSTTKGETMEVEYGINEMNENGIGYNPLEKNCATVDEAIEAGLEYLRENPELTSIEVFALYLENDCISHTQKVRTLTRQELSHENTDSPSPG